MYEEYIRYYIGEHEFNKIEDKNTTYSEHSIGRLSFDRFLFSQGWKCNKGAIRNAYHPFSTWFNPSTGECLSINFGIKSYDNKQSRDFYISIHGMIYEVPSNEKEFQLFLDGKLKLLNFR